MVPPESLRNTGRAVAWNWFGDFLVLFVSLIGVLIVVSRFASVDLVLYSLLVTLVAHAVITDGTAGRRRRARRAAEARGVVLAHRESIVDPYPEWDIAVGAERRNGHQFHDNYVGFVT